MEVAGNLGIDKNNVTDFKNQLLAASKGEDITTDKTKKTELGRLISHNVSFIAAKTNAINHLRVMLSGVMDNEALSAELKWGKE
jgi:hypothetical protein